MELYLQDTNEPVIIQPDLKQTFENKFTMNIAYYELIKMKDAGVITDKDISIVKFIFQFKFATARQIGKLFGEPAKTIKIRLDKLVKYRVLNKFMLGRIVDDRVQDDSLQIYCLDFGGKHLLKNYSTIDVSDWISVVNMKDSGLISKDLLATEIYLRVAETLGEKLVSFITGISYNANKRALEPTFEMCLDVIGQKKYYIGECVRDYDFPVYFKEKIQKYDSFLTSNAWKKPFYDSDSTPVLFVFGDSDETVLEAGKIISSMTNIEAYRFSTDARIQKTLYDFGAFLKYDVEKGELQEIKASTFQP